MENNNQQPNNLQSGTNGRQVQPQTRPVQPAPQARPVQGRPQQGRPVQPVQFQPVHQDKQIKPIDPKAKPRPYVDPNTGKKLSKKERKHMDLPGDPLQYRGLNSWAKFAFVMVCVSLGVILLTFALPVVCFLIACIILIFWVLVIFCGTIFTLGLMWTSPDTKTFFASWREAGEFFINIGNKTGEIAMMVIPVVAITGGVFILLAWLLHIIGICKDKARKKGYTARMIALAVITTITIVAVIFLFISLGNAASAA